MSTEKVSSGKNERGGSAVTSEMVTACLRAFRPFLDEAGHLDSFSAQEAVEAGLGAAFQLRSVARDTGSEKVTSLINKAAEAAKADDALKFSQAAANAANALCALKTAESMP
jgi:hypothetical protein